MQSTVIALMHDQPDVLNRVVSLFRRRSFNIDSFSIATTERPGLSHMTVVVERDEAPQVVRQLQRLGDVVEVRDVTFQSVIEQEHCLVRVTTPGSRLGEFLRIARECEARVLDVTAHAVLLTAAGTPEMISRFIARIGEFGVLELARSGRIATTMTGARPAEPRVTPHTSSGDQPAIPFTAQADGA